MDISKQEGCDLMANYHFQVDIVSRGKGRSVTGLASYISGRKLYDCYDDKDLL